jgi:MFS family permease
VIVNTMRRSLGRFVLALEYPEFRTMWLGVMAAQAAAWALIVARGWLVFDVTGSSMAVGVVTFAAMAPMFFMPPIAGVLADKWDRRTLLASSYAINLFQNLVLAILALTGVIAADEFRGRLASINTFSLGGIMSFMNLANGYLGTHFPAATILLVNGLLFALIMVASAAFAIPRGVYLRGMPTPRAAASTAASSA